MPQPSPEDQVRFLLNVQRLLKEGAFTASYKFAMLLALADLAVETGDETGAALTVPSRPHRREVHRVLLATSHPVRRQRKRGVLQQNTDRQAAIIGYIL